MNNPVALTFADVVGTLPESKERDEVSDLLKKEEPESAYSRRTIFLLIGIALALAARAKSET